MFPSNGSYQVRTLVNGSSLDECSLIRSNDKVRPYFAVSVVNDPDLIGLLVYIQDPRGEVIGEKVQYTLLPYASETALTETDLQEAAEPDEMEEPVSEVEDEEDADDGDQDGDKEETELPEYQIRERWSFTDAKPVEEKNANIEIAVQSLAQELPYFPLPKEMEIGPYVLVFEVLGKKDILSRTETNVFYLGNAEFNLKDISMYLSGLSGQQLISPETVVMLEATLDFDSRLDPYVIWYNGKAVISEGKISNGAGKLLWKAPEQAGFYSLRMEAFPVRLKRATYTGVSREIALPVSPKAISLGYFFENNHEHTARSPLAAGTAYPEHAQLLTTLTQEEETPSEVSYPAPELLQWYQFEGSLRDSLSTVTNEQFLLPANESQPQWAAAGQSYGLSVGPDYPYQLSPVNFFREETDQGGGILLLHVRPLSEGIIFSAFFPLQSSLTEGVWMNLIKKENVLALRLSTADALVDLPVFLAFSAADSFIPVAVEFYIRPYRLEAKISLDDYAQNKVGGIKLPLALSGEGRIRLGGNNKAALAALTLNSAKYQEEVFLEETDASIPAVVKTFSDTVWDELAVLFSAVPLLPEELLETGAEETDAAMYAEDVQREAEPAAAISTSALPADTEPAETDDADIISVDIPPVDTDTDNSVQEQETQERAALTVISENF